MQMSLSVREHALERYGLQEPPMPTLCNCWLASTDVLRNESDISSTRRSLLLIPRTKRIRTPGYTQVSLSASTSGVSLCRRDMH